MKLFQAYHLLILLSLTTTSIAIPTYSMTGCKDTCGNVMIPYPFGIGANCSVNQWYNIDCNSLTPYLPALNHLEVLSVNLNDQIVTVNMPKISDCQNTSSQTNSIDLGNTPFIFSKSHNKFVFEGCGNAALMDNESVLTGCSTSCRNDTLNDRTKCFGISCCHTTIPHYLTSYSINMEMSGDLAGQTCGSTFLVDNNQGSFNRSIGFVRISLLWTLKKSDIDQISCCNSLAADKMFWDIRSVDLGNNTSIDIQKCSSLTYLEGNPYLAYGCEYTEECSRCKNSGGFCNEVVVVDVDDLVTKRNFSCVVFTGFGIPGQSPGVIAGGSTCLGVILVVSIYVLYKVIKKTKNRKRRRRFFKRNGGMLLKQREEADRSLADKPILFTSHELEKATDHFNENRVLGRGGQGTVYKGMLVDGSIVAVKKSKIVDESQLEQFINEVVILSQVNHRNVVKLIGCCLETDVPLLVSEFIPNGTLSECLHNNTNEFQLSLNMRLQIAIEVAGALAYLHSATYIPIYHRDIKTSNILLDDKYRAKVMCSELH